MEGAFITRPIYLSEIIQIDNYTFTIKWSDGSQGNYRLSDLQEKCPCANCNDEITGKKLLNPLHVKEDVRAIRITNVGRYALRIQFTSGCSAGIYDYNMLYDMMTGSIVPKQRT